jgi:hypothetical protein
MLQDAFILATPDSFPATCDFALFQKQPGTAMITSGRASAFSDALQISTSENDLHPFVAFIKTYADIPECIPGQISSGKYFAIPAVPNLTICKECFRNQQGLQRSGHFEETLSSGFTYDFQSQPVQEMLREFINDGNIVVLGQRFSQLVAQYKQTHARATRLKSDVMEAQTTVQNLLELSMLASFTQGWRNWAADVSGQSLYSYVCISSDIFHGLSFVAEYTTGSFAEHALPTKCGTDSTEDDPLGTAAADCACSMGKKWTEHVPNSAI